MSSRTARRISRASNVRARSASSMRYHATPPARSTSRPCARNSRSLPKSTRKPPTPDQSAPLAGAFFFEVPKSEETPKKPQGIYMNKKLSLFAAATAMTLFATHSAYAQKAYDTGVTDTEIKIGNVEAYSGPASAYGVIGKTEEAYFKMINDQGGINGRKINWISYDDGYSPPKTVEQIRKLIESDEVFL